MSMAASSNGGMLKLTKNVENRARTINKVVETIKSGRRLTKDMNLSKQRITAIYYERLAGHIFIRKQKLYSRSNLFHSRSTFKRKTFNEMIPIVGGYKVGL